MTFKTISIVGLGYIGLPTAAILASKQKYVLGIDTNQGVVDTINSGKIHIVEPGLEKLVNSAVSKKFLKAVTKPEPSDAFLIAVPTPLSETTNKNKIPEPDLSFIKSAIKSIGTVLKKGDLIILESTSPVGTTVKISKWLSKIRPDLTFPHKDGEQSDIRIAYCPERVLPGQVVKELVGNDRIIGGITEKCSILASQFYKIFVDGKCTKTNDVTAEMTKLTENASRDLSIAFSNELSIICDKLGIDVWHLIELANRHPRVNILQPGPGVGGHCIAVDPWFIVSKTKKEAKLIKTARLVNDSKPNWVVSQVKSALKEFLKSHPEKSSKDVVIACFGLSYKPDIDDLRESPSILIIKSISSFHSGKILCVEPHIKDYSGSENLELVSFKEAETRADIGVLLVDHKEFRDSGIPNIKFIIDTKGIWR